jgi:hypothetical protein
VEDAYGNPYGKPAHVILASLDWLLAQLDDPGRADDHAKLRGLAGLAMRELASQYGIKP